MDKVVVVTITIWLLFGLGNFFSHTLTCAQCRHRIGGVIDLFTHGCVQTLTWPVQAWDYLLWYFDKNPEMQFFARPIHQEENESHEDFQKRVARILKGFENIKGERHAENREP